MPSPLLSPAQYVNKINSLSSEGITIDKGVAQAKRDAAEFASKYAADFQLVTELKTSTAQFNDRWTDALQQTRDAASSISAWYQRFDEVFLSLINDISSDQDAKDVITEFNSLLGETHPSEKYRLQDSPGVKTAFNEIEGFVPEECTHVVNTLKNNSDWRKGVSLLKQNLGGIQAGIRQIRQALNNYATKLE